MSFSKNSIHYPVRTVYYWDVLIRIMTIGQDRGEGNRMALSSLATGNDAFSPNNHVVPVVHGDMTFAVSPPHGNWL